MNQKTGSLYFRFSACEFTNKKYVIKTMKSILICNQIIANCVDSELKPLNYFP